MPDPRWTGPPEGVALIFEAGSPASVVANNAVWVTETANKEVSTGLSAINTLVTAAQWQGVGSVASVVAATGLNAGLQTLVGWTAEKISVTLAAVEAFMIARSSVSTDSTVGANAYALSATCPSASTFAPFATASSTLNAIS